VKLHLSDSRRYGIAVVSVFAATLLTLSVEPLFGGRAPLFFFTLAVVASAAFGVGPGLLATALSVSSALLFFHEIFALVLLHSNLMLFAIVGAGISIVLGRMQSANTQLRKARADLEAANKQLSEQTQLLSQSNDELRRFAYSVAHDLSTPVRSIAALTELLVHRNLNRLDESSRECAALITGKAGRIQAMIKGLLDYAAAVDKSDTPASADAGVAVRKALQDVDSLIVSSGAQITFDPLPLVAAHESQLVQVFSNLISNAVKYRHRARAPRVHVSAAGQGNQFVFCVRDNGIGLDMRDADTVFGMFKRLHGDEYDGSGIGLALCKAIVESRGGRIWLESQLGEGTAFYFTLPKASAAIHAPESSELSVRAISARN